VYWTHLHALHLRILVTIYILLNSNEPLTCKHTNDNAVDSNWYLKVLVRNIIIIKLPYATRYTIISQIFSLDFQTYPRYYIVKYNKF